MPSGVVVDNSGLKHYSHLRHRISSDPVVYGEVMMKRGFALACLQVLAEAKAGGIAEQDAGQTLLSS